LTRSPLVDLVRSLIPGSVREAGTRLIVGPSFEVDGMAIHAVYRGTVQPEPSLDGDEPGLERIGYVEIAGDHADFIPARSVYARPEVGVGALVAFIILAALLARWLRR
jgi:hypothetical protein